VDVVVDQETLRFREPMRTAHGELRERPVLRVRITGPDGVTGMGEAAPLEAYDGVRLEDTWDALEAHAAVLRDGDRMSGGQLLDACRAAADVPHALAAIDMALWDRAGRRAGRPVAALLTDRPLERVPVNATEGVVDPHGNVFGYPGLHIADGSIMPGPVGPNPSFTIAALADRFADSMLEPDHRAAEAAAA